MVEKMARCLLIVGTMALGSACSEVCKPDSAQAGQCEAPDDPGNQLALGCQAIDNPDLSLQPYARFTPTEKRNNPEAGDPEYIYLKAGSEAVVLEGPETFAGDGGLTITTPSIYVFDKHGSSADGYKVVVNSNLRYMINMDDFEYEVTVARVELCQRNGNVESHFVFAATPGASGVVHSISIGTSGTAGPILPPTDHVSIEVR
jgi:hypothetical protein